MAKITKTILFPMLAVILTAGLWLSGCSSAATTVPGTTEVTTQPSSTLPASSVSPAEQVKYEQALGTAATSLDNLDTYRYDMIMDMDMDITGGEEAGSITMKTSSTGGINKTTNEMELKMGITLEDAVLGDTGPQTMGYDFYQLTDWAYMRLDVPGIGEQWMKTMTSGIDGSFDLNMAQKQTAVLENPTTIKYLRTEKLNGVDCYVLSIEPTMEEMAKWYNEQGSNQLADGVDYGDIIKSFSIICYVTADTNLLARMTMNMTMSFTATQASVAADSFDNMNVDVVMDMTIHDQNKPFTVVLPDDAANATEVSGETFSSMQ
jgi:hypothetical protein